VVSIAAHNSGQSPARQFVWKPTVKFEAGEIPPIEGSIAEDDWKAKPGRDIAAGATPDALGSEMISVSLTDYAARRWPTASGYESVVLHVRIEFSYSDVFDSKNDGTAYFVGVVHARAHDDDTPRGLLIGEWACDKLHPTTASKTWTLRDSLIGPPH
jgi:hypothetical protein